MRTLLIGVGACIASLTTGLAAPVFAANGPVSDSSSDNAPDYDGRGDVITQSARYDDNVIGVSVTTRTYEDPASGNWQNFLTGIQWSVVTPSGEYKVTLSYLIDRPHAWVSDANFNTLCETRPVSGPIDGAGFYAAEFPASCFGDPAWIRTQAFFLYQTPDTVSGDFAPDLDLGPTVHETDTPVSTPSDPQPPGDTPLPGDVSRSGYWMVDANGTVYSFGDAKHFGDDVASTVKRVDVEPTPSGNGYWILGENGSVHDKGDAKWLGAGRGTLQVGEKAAALSSTPSGNGYWIFTDRGRVLAFGDASHKGDMAGVRLNGSVLDSVATPSGQGYWMVASDGGIFSFGDAKFFGSMGGTRLNQPVISMAPDPDRIGYWLVASDGGIFAFDADFHGSMGATRLNKPISGMVPGKSGYLMVGEDGGIFAFGDVKFHGSLGSNSPASPVVAVALLP